jgi:hypothetical protein
MEILSIGIMAMGQQQYYQITLLPAHSAGFLKAIPV